MNELNNCIFCKIMNGELPCTKVDEDEHTFSFLSANPESPAHTLVIPKQHCRNIIDCPPETLNHVMATVQRLSQKYIADGYTCVKIAQNNEKPLQEVFHLHFHVIPYKHK